MTFERDRYPETLDDHLALLPPGLRAFLQREVEAGNSIAEAGTGFPAAPVGVWVRMRRPFGSDFENVPEGVIHRARPNWMWPAECTDPERHFFILSGSGAALAKPVPPKVAPAETTVPAPKPPETVYRPKPVFNPHPVATPFSGIDQMDKWSDDLRVSDAIAKHLGLMWSPETEAAIRAEVGNAGLARVHEIDDFANRAEVWTRGDHDRNYQRIQQELADQYPFLSPAAIQRLSTRAAWGWR